MTDNRAEPTATPTGAGVDPSEMDDKAFDERLHRAMGEGEAAGGGSDTGSGEDRPPLSVP